jgi:hypothetical protein
MLAAEIDAASTTGVKRTSIEKNHDAIRLAAARTTKPPPKYERHRLPPNLATAIATATEGIPIISATIQEFGSSKVAFLRVSTYAFSRGVRSPKDHKAKLSPAANEATATDIDIDLKTGERSKFLRD